ncbi:hypothetical protein EVA_08697 [gut metagenome]|uniref:Uncharacterized protein n=1 Tax=gut metagenome TaxID=749906 RepID=J9CSL8_9ZZZZ
MKANASLFPILTHLNPHFFHLFSFTQNLPFTLHINSLCISEML